MGKGTIPEGLGDNWEGSSSPGVWLLYAFTEFAGDERSSYGEVPKGT